MGSSEAHIRACSKYNKKIYDGITIRTRKDSDVSREKINEAATAAGLSLNAFIVEAIREKIERETPEIEREPFTESS